MTSDVADEASRTDQGDDALLERSLTEAELEDLNDAEPVPTEVTFTSQDFDVEGLVRRIRRGSLIVPTFGEDTPAVSTAGFQRGFVWRRPQMDRFIESLLLGYPIPGIFLVKQEDNTYLVLDGQQRIRTLEQFYDGEFALRNVGEQFQGLTYKTLPSQLVSRLDDSYMQSTILDSDGSETSNEAIYQIFERVNSGGTQLTPHEIRMALYAGPLITEMERLNQTADWRALYGAKSSRARDQELVLRIIALYLDADRYRRPLKSFLNAFASRNRFMRQPAVGEAAELFIKAAEALRRGPDTQALRRPGGRQVNVAQSEAIFVAVMRAISAKALPADGALTDGVDALLGNDTFKRATLRATADSEAVKDRLRVATETLTDSSQ